MEAPPQSLQIRLCAQMLLPPQSTHSRLRRPFGHFVCGCVVLALFSLLCVSGSSRTLPSQPAASPSPWHSRHLPRCLPSCLPSRGVKSCSRVDSDTSRLMVSRTLVAAGEARCRALEVGGAHEARVAWAAPRGFPACPKRAAADADDG